MNIELTLGWWLLPAFVTVVAFATSWWGFRQINGGEPIDSRDCAGAILLGVFHMAAATVSLLAWLIWAVLT